MFRSPCRGLCQYPFGRQKHPLASCRIPATSPILVLDTTVWPRKGHGERKSGHMAKTAPERLARLHGDSEPTGSFTAELLAPAHLLKLEVSGVGPVRIPFRAPLAKKPVATPGHSPRIRSRSAGPTGQRCWTVRWSTFVVSSDSRRRHGYEPSRTRCWSTARAVLSPHQDSEMHDAMVGTLVVSLPSAHTGGALVINHAGESTTYRAPKEELTSVAFYADCRHQVTPVKIRVPGDAHVQAPQQRRDPDPEACPAEFYRIRVDPVDGGRRTTFSRAWLGLVVGVVNPRRSVPGFSPMPQSTGHVLARLF